MTTISTSSTSSNSSSSSSSSSLASGSTKSVTNYSKITGLSSGLDIDSIVNGLMTAERVPLDKLEQQKQILEWQQSDYRTLNTALYTFETTASDMRYQRTFLARKAASSDESVATATAAANATDGTYDITVNRLATSVSRASTAALANGKDTNGNSLTLFEQFPELANRPVSSTDPTKLTSTDTISVTINGTALTFDLGVDNMGTVASKINEANLGVTASYDSSLNRFFLNTSNTGSDAKITISSDAANFFSNGTGTNTNTSLLNLNINEGTSYTGQNASIKFGDADGLESASNAITVNGITIKLKELGSSTLSVTRDTDTVISSITNLITAYNTALKTLYDKVNEKRNSDYPPLTDTQKAQMNDSQIADWNTKAKSGLLRDDPMTKNIVDNLRNTMTGVVAGISGTYKTLASIGIASSSYEQNGQLIVNKDTLLAAITKDPDAVEALFTNSSTTSSQQGVAVQLYNTTVKGISYLADKAGSDSSTSTIDSSYIGKQLTTLGTKITDWEKKLKTKEDKYYKKFSDMETAIYKLNAQSTWISSMLGSSS